MELQVFKVLGRQGRRSWASFTSKAFSNVMDVQQNYQAVARDANQNIFETPVTVLVLSFRFEFAFVVPSQGESSRNAGPTCALRNFRLLQSSIKLFQELEDFYVAVVCCNNGSPIYVGLCQKEASILHDSSTLKISTSICAFTPAERTYVRHRSI